MKYLIILVLLALPDSLNVDTVEIKVDTVENKVHKQTEQMNQRIGILSTKFDSLLILLQNDTLRKKN